jgi:pyruvate dehydrogenase (quinone)
MAAPTVADFLLERLRARGVDKVFAFPADGVLATSGPGAIHLLDGLYDGKLDHLPVVAIA